MFLTMVACEWVDITPGYVATRRPSRPALRPMAFTLSVKPWIAIVTLGIPAFSATMLARELAAVQLPHPPLPEMTASTLSVFNLPGSALMTSDSERP